MSASTKRQVGVIITAFCALVVVSEYYFTIQVVKDLSAYIQGLAVVVAGFAIGIGIINMAVIHVGRFRRKGPNWLLSAWLLFVMLVVIVLGLVWTPSSQAYSWIFANIYATVGATMWSVVAFYLATACFYALRARNVEGVLLLIAAVVTLIGVSPIGGVVPYVSQAAIWIRDVPSNAGMRAILLGTAIGGIGLAIRTMLGREKGATI